ncbi:MAG: orotate phosphoribosyltransferase [Longicatena sp.]
MNIEKLVAKNLLDIKAVSLQPNDPFTWASGIKSPIYCDNRLVLSFPEKRSVVVDAFVQLIKDEYDDADVIIGTSTAGIPWGALVADKLEKPFGYVRSSNKTHGKGNKIEGKVEKGQKVVVVEDLISTGGSVKDVVDSLREAGAQVIGVVAIFTYLLPIATQVFNELACEFKTLSNYDALIEVALELDYIKTTDLAKLKAWKKDPKDESWMHQ